MASHTYEIRIKLDGFSDGKNNSPVAPSASSQSGNTDTTDSSITAKDVLGLAKKAVAYTGVKNLADTYIRHEVSTVALKTGAVEYEQKLSFIQGEVSRGINAVAGTIMAGAAAGPAGVAVAAVGNVINGIMRVYQWFLNADTLRLQKQLEDVSMVMGRVRSGLSGSRGQNQ